MMPSCCVFAVFFCVFFNCPMNDIRVILRGVFFLIFFYNTTDPFSTSEEGVFLVPCFFSCGLTYSYSINNNNVLYTTCCLYEKIATRSFRDECIYTKYTLHKYIYCFRTSVNMQNTLYINISTVIELQYICRVD